MELLKQKRFWAILSLPLTALLLKLSDSSHEAVEWLFSGAVYPLLAGLFGRIFSIFPFSAAEFVLAGVIGFAVYHIVMLIRRMYTQKTERRRILMRFIANVSCIVGIGYFVWAMICGLNYQRLSFTRQSGLDVRPSPVEELKQLSIDLIAAANASRELVGEDQNGVMILSAPSYYALAQDAQRVFSYAAQLYPQLGGYVGRPKPVLFSPVMSWLDIGGVYSPFTFESNVNVHMPDYSIPATMMHEMAHFKGFMREEEANFIAYVASRESGEPDFIYSGNMLAMIHTTNALYNADRAAYWEVMSELSPGVLRDLANNNAYWSRFDGPAAQVSNAVNDVYLRANNQAGGVKSYGGMVDLLLAEWRAKGRI